MVLESSEEWHPDTHSCYYYNFYGPELHSDVTHAQKEEVAVKKADLQEMIKEKLGESFEFVDKGKWRQKIYFQVVFIKNFLFEE